MTCHRLATLLVLTAFLATAAAGQDMATVTGELPGPLADIGFDQRPGQPLPLDLVMNDADGNPVELASLFGQRPVILTPVYYTCPMLCGMVLNGLVTSLKTLPFEPGRDYEVVAFSFDPNDGAEQATARKNNAVARYGGDETGAGFHFLTGDQEAIARLTEAIGFRYAQDGDSGEFAHTAGLVLATPDGRIARQLFGVEYAPRDMRLGLVEASEGKIGGLVDQVLLYCFHYDPAIGKYSAMTMNLVRLGGVLTLGALAAFVLLMLWRERRAAALPAITGAGPDAAPGGGR
jgi:protein SCO1/2